MNLSELEGIKISCNKVKISNVLFEVVSSRKYPFVVSKEATGIELLTPTPLHGRSLVVGFNPDTNRYTVTKGNGLTYFPYRYISTREIDDSFAWGFLREQDAIRDFQSGNFIKGLGILTNNMESVYSLKAQPINMTNEIKHIQPHILQYSVRCPYRIADIPFLSNKTITKFTEDWHTLTDENYTDLHCIATDIFLKNTRIMHDYNVLHNAIHSQNYSLSLELLDFELSRTPVTPYENSEDENHYETLKSREIIQSLEIVNQIAFFFKEKINLKTLERIFEKYNYSHFLK